MLYLRCLQALEEERDGLSHILGRERSHGTGLEQIIEASRLREARVAAEHRQLSREKDRLEAKVIAFSWTYNNFIWERAFPRVLVLSLSYT